MTLFIPTFTGDKTIEKPATTPKTGDKIGDIMKKTIFDYIVSHPNCKSTDIASCVGLQISQTKWYLNQLTEEEEKSFSILMPHLPRCTLTI